MVVRVRVTFAVWDTKFDREREVGSVRASLVPSLDGGTDRGKDNSKDKSLGLAPLV